MEPAKYLFFALALIITLALSSCTPTSSSPPVEFEPTVDDTIGIEEETRPTETALPVRIEYNVEYVPDGEVRQNLDVYLPPEGNGPFTTFLAIHGGAFRTRSKSLYGSIANHFAQQGYAFVPTNFRQSQNASYPAQVEDVFCALAWVHANQDTYGFDPEQIYVWGGSSGGYLAAMVGTVDTPEMYLKDCPYELPEENWLAGMILFYGFYDFTEPDSLDAFPEYSILNDLEPYWGAPYEELAPELIVEMSPMSWINGDEPPALLIHGTEDVAVATWTSERFAAALTEEGIDAELVLIDSGHAFELNPLTGPEMSRSLEAIGSFLTNLSEISAE